jgi:UDP-N-acetyl-D-galactosamine dehydrogenase
VDPYYLTHKAEMLGYHPQVILAGRRINDGMAAYIAQQTVKQMINNGTNIKGAKVIVLGLTFKENCADLRNSKVADVVQELQDFGCEVHVHDPLAEPGQALHEYGISLREWGQLPQNADAIVAAVSHAEYTGQPVPRLLVPLKPGGVFIDVKSAYEPQAVIAAGATLWRL